MNGSDFLKNIGCVGWMFLFGVICLVIIVVMAIFWAIKTMF